MGEAPLGPVFACEVNAYVSITHTPAQRLGIGALGEANDCMLRKTLTVSCPQRTGK